jgi:hypothetical protein
MPHLSLKRMTLHAVLILLALSSCMPPKNSGINRTPSGSAHMEAVDRTRSKSEQQRALDEYRKGNLAGAISIWKGILEFDPHNADVMKEIDTATIQLKNLQPKSN